MYDPIYEAPIRSSISWLHSQALTVLAEMLTSDDEHIALRAAQTVLILFNRDGSTLNEARAAQKEGRIAGRNANAAPRPASGPTASAGEPGEISRGGLRETLGKNRDR